MRRLCFDWVHFLFLAKKLTSMGGGGVGWGDTIRMSWCAFSRKKTTTTTVVGREIHSGVESTSTPTILNTLTFIFLETFFMILKLRSIVLNN